jgi:hypothetical protein
VSAADVRSQGDGEGNLVAVRHLTLDQARAALRRGNSIEQLLHLRNVDGRPTVSWLTLSPTRDAELELRLHFVLDVGTEQFAVVAEFPPVDDEEYAGEGKTMGWYREAQDALDDAHREWGASLERWVNQGVVCAEYLGQHAERP